MHGLVTIEMAHLTEQEHMRAALMRQNARILRRERLGQTVRARVAAWLSRPGAREQAAHTAAALATARLHGESCADAG